MNTKEKKKLLSEKEIDEIVVAQADEDSAWGKSIRVQTVKPASVSLTSDLSTRAAFFARLHREREVEAWVRRILQERLDLEEAAFVGLKRELAARSEG